MYAAKFIQRRRERGLWSVEDDEVRLRLHVLPHIGDLPVAETRIRHIREMFHKLSAEGRTARGRKLAPHTLHNIKGVVHRMFKDAMVDELITSNPCVLAPEDLPALEDRAEFERDAAVFTHAEVELLCFDPRLEWDRRVKNALRFFLGGRDGELNPLLWSDWQPSKQPLGQMRIERSFNTRREVLKETKTRQIRFVPVHPTLERVLTAWRETGWRQMMNRDPTPDDLIIPSREGRIRRANHELRRFHWDCEKLEIAKRRQQDGRRTFISLCLGDGAREDILKWVTHPRRKKGKGGGSFEMYTTIPWHALCAEVAKLRVPYRGPVDGAPSSVSPPQASMAETHSVSPCQLDVAAPDVAVDLTTHTGQRTTQPREITSTDFDKLFITANNTFDLSVSSPVPLAPRRPPSS
jgi:hypothetical protein